MGQAFKSTPYKIYTRVNFALANVMNDYIESVFNLDGIDIVGDDPHEENVATIAKAIEEYSLTGNYPHIAENHANYANTNTLILSSFAKNGGYIMYEVATSEYFVNNNSGTTDPEYGLYKSDLTPKQHTAGVGRFLKMLNGIGCDLVTTPKEQIKAFNVETNYPSAKYSQSVTIGERTVNFETDKGSLGIVINCGEYLVIATDKGATISGLDDLSCEQGLFDGKVWNKQSDISLTGGVLNCEEYGIYKIGVQK